MMRRNESKKIDAKSVCPPAVVHNVRNDRDDLFVPFHNCLWTSTLEDGLVAINVKP
jgi:hypothetical protein